MSDSSNICLSCGLCCDGTLIGFVELSREEMPTLKKIMDIEDDNGHGFFLQPCNSFCNGCNVYSDRPKHCASFKCELLKSVEQKNLEFDLAVETISIVKQKKISRVLFLVRRLCIRGALRMSVGLVGFVDVCGVVAIVCCTPIVSVVKIVANVRNASLCRPLWRMLLVWRRRIAVSNSRATLVAVSIGCSVGISQCSG